MEPAIKIENISKQYRLGTVGTGTFANDVNRWWHTIIGKEDPYLKIGEANDRSTNGKSDYVWALRNIDFEVMPGEVLGIIGKNGAGKSTLLKLLSRVTAPTTGRISANGRIASLLEVGTGFHPELTGRENVFLNGAIMGMTKAEIKSKFDEIVAFSGCERYIDTPVKRYSSGMYVRLAFAVAAHLEPEILVVDEVLAVGDAEFQKKAIGKMQDVSKNDGRTVLFVSHNMPSIQALCTRALVLKNGTHYYTGDTRTAIENYLEDNQNRIYDDLSLRKDRVGNGNLIFKEVRVINEYNIISTLQTGKSGFFELYFDLNLIASKLWFRVIIVDRNETVRFVCNNYHSSGPFTSVGRNINKATLSISDFPLPEGEYYYHIQAVVNTQVGDQLEYAGKFTVHAGDFFGTGKLPGNKEGVLVKHSWELND